MTIVREYSATDLNLPAGSEILSASFPFSGDKLELIIRTPEEPYTLTPGFEDDGQGFLFSVNDLS